MALSLHFMKKDVTQIRINYPIPVGKNIYDLITSTDAYYKQQILIEDLKQSAIDHDLKTFDHFTTKSSDISFKDCSIYYLGLNKHPHIIKKAKEAIDLYGIWNNSAVSGSYTILSKVLKQRFERFFNKEECLLFSNEVIFHSSIIPALCMGMETFIIIDEESHISTIQGCSVSGAKFRPFKHNSVKDLDNKLKWSTAQYKNVLVIVEAAYSMGGDISPLREIVELKKKHDFLLYVDETYTFGFYGKNGTGICNELGITNDVDFIITSLSKATAGIGGVIATSKKFAALIQLSSSYHFQPNIPPVEVAIVNACLDVIESESDIISSLWENTNYVRQQLTDLGFDVRKSKSPIVSVYIREAEIIKKLEEELSQQGIFTMAVQYPVVEVSEAHLRFVINNSDNLKDIDDFIFVLLELGKKYGLINKEVSYKRITSSVLPKDIDNEVNDFLQDVNTHLDNRIDSFYQHSIAPRKNKQHLVINKMLKKGDILLNSNDYLCVSSHPSIIKARIKHLSEEHKEVLMSAVFLQKGSPQLKLQEKFANFLNFEASILSQSGWVANVGLLQSIADAKTPVYIDQLAHASLWEGINFAGAKPIMFPHNNIDRFKRALSKYGSGIVLVDSLYSTIGTICPLKEMIEIAKEHHCIVVVDESHSLGVYGENGRGLVHALGLTDKVDFLTASLAKAFGGRAGLITCTKKFASYFPYVATPAIFSSALLENEIVSLDATLDVIMDADDRRKKLHDNATYLRNGIKEMGIKTVSQSQIIALVVGTEEQTEKVRDMLDNQGVIGAVFCYPATSKNRTLIRMTVNSDFNKNDLNKILSAVKNVAEYIKK